MVDVRSIIRSHLAPLRHRRTRSSVLDQPGAVAAPTAACDVCCCPSIAAGRPVPNRYARLPLLTSGRADRGLEPAVRSLEGRHDRSSDRGLPARPLPAVSGAESSRTWYRNSITGLRSPGNNDYCEFKNGPVRHTKRGSFAIHNSQVRSHTFGNRLLNSDVRIAGNTVANGGVLTFTTAIGKARTFDFEITEAVCRIAPGMAPLRAPCSSATLPRQRGHRLS